MHRKTTTKSEKCLRENHDRNLHDRFLCMNANECKNCDSQALTLRAFARRIRIRIGCECRTAACSGSDNCTHARGAERRCTNTTARDVTEYTTELRILFAKNAKSQSRPIHVRISQTKQCPPVRTGEGSQSHTGRSLSHAKSYELTWETEKNRQQKFMERIYTTMAPYLQHKRTSSTPIAGELHTTPTDGAWLH